MRLLLLLAICTLNLPAAVPAFRAVASTAVAGTGPTVIAKPTGTVTDDVMFAMIVVRPHTTAVTPDTGWTSVKQCDNATAGLTFHVFTKKAGGSEGSDYSFDFTTSGTSIGGAIVSYSGAIASGEYVDVAGACQNGGPDTSAIAAGFRTLSLDTRLIWFGATEDNVSSTPPAAFSERVDGERIISDISKPTTVTTGAQVATLALSDLWTAVMVAVRSEVPYKRRRRFLQ